MEVSTTLRARIEKANDKIERDYRRTLAEVQKIKNVINQLEQQSVKRSLKGLHAAIKYLNGLTDYQILRSKKAWEKYEKLELKCNQYAEHPVELAMLKEMCEKTEKLAADLLCYSLAHFKQAAEKS